MALETAATYEKKTKNADKVIKLVPVAITSRKNHTMPLCQRADQLLSPKAGNLSQSKEIFTFISRIASVLANRSTCSASILCTALSKGLLGG